MRGVTFNFCRAMAVVGAFHPAQRIRQCRSISIRNHAISNHRVARCVIQFRTHAPSRLETPDPRLQTNPKLQTPNSKLSHLLIAPT